MFPQDAGIDPLLGTKVHRVASLKNSSVPGDARSRESSTVSKESSAYSEPVYVGQFQAVFSFSVNFFFFLRYFVRQSKVSVDPKISYPSIITRYILSSSHSNPPLLN